MICPATVDDTLGLELATQAKRAHRALGCRDYSLFDFRVDAETGEAYLLEACLFWTCGPISIISRMIEGGGEDAAAWATQVWHNAIERAGTTAAAA